MGVILARSPFFVNNQGFDENASLTLEIGVIEGGGSITIGQTYNLNFKKQLNLDISQLIMGEFGDDEYIKYVKTTVIGAISGVSQTNVVSEYFATKGYFYYEEGYNKDISSELLAKSYYGGSNTTIYKLDDGNIVIPILGVSNNNDVVTVSFRKGADILYSETLPAFSSSNGSANLVQYISSTPSVNFEYRVVNGGGVIEETKCLDNFFEQFKVEDLDSIVISSSQGVEFLDVVTLEECRNTPYKIEFINKNGVKEDLWFFKRSDKSLNVTRESYRKNTFDSYSQGDLSKHSYSHFNINGREMMSLNTGWLPESFYENFKQLYLSEEAWIYYNNERIPISIKSTELSEKKHINEKLINYRIEIEFAFDVIGNIV